MHQNQTCTICRHQNQNKHTGALTRGNKLLHRYENENPGQEEWKMEFFFYSGGPGIIGEKILAEGTIWVGAEPEKLALLTTIA